MPPEHKLADAIRKVTLAIQKAIDADDLVEELLAIADQLDPPMRLIRPIEGVVNRGYPRLLSPELSGARRCGRTR